jgi:hypothetical protein
MEPQNTSLQIAPRLLPETTWWHGVFRRTWALFLGALLWHNQPVAAAEPAVPKEYQIKAAFLYNFTKFVEWPAEKFQDATSPVVIGVFGKNPFGSELELAVKGRKVNGRDIVVKQIETPAEAKTVHVLFAGADESPRYAQLEDALKEGSVLGVGESEAFVRSGGTILFVLEGDKVRFEININSAERAGLKISAQLQKLAKAIRKQN